MRPSMLPATVSRIQWHWVKTRPRDVRGKAMISIQWIPKMYQYIPQKKAQAAASPLGIDFPCSKSLILQSRLTDAILVGRSRPKRAFIGRMKKAAKTRI